MVFMSKNKIKKYFLPIFGLAILYIAFPFIYIIVDESFFIKTPKCNLSEELIKDNINANAGCVIIQNNKILVAKFYGKDIYAIPGGTKKRGESAACTAHRETFEESGIDSKIIKRMFIANNGFNVFLCEAQNKINLNYSKKYEIDGILFLPIENIDHYRYPEQLQKIKNYLDSES